MPDEKELPRDWDWVTARADCSERKFFERLYLGAQQNIKARVDGLEDRDRGGRTLFRHESSDGLFSVFTEASGAPMVRFRLEGKRIVVEGENPHMTFAGSLTLNNQGKCRLRVEADELDEWQVLKRALEHVLFPV